MKPRDVKDNAPSRDAVRLCPQRPNECRLWWAIAASLVLATVAVYWPVTGFQFIELDDALVMTSLPHVRAGLSWEGLKWVWSANTVGNWHPVTLLSFMLDCQLFGVKPWWPHLVNVLLHAANAVLVFGLLTRMTGALWRSAMVAGLFALHPLRVESVAWICERKDVLSAFFWLLAIWAYVRYAEELRARKSNFKFYGLSLVLGAMGMMSKQMAVTLPLTLLLLDWWPLGRKKEWRLVWEKVPFFALSAAVSLVALAFQKGVIADKPVSWRIGNALVSYARYIGMMFWPRHLSPLYLARPEPWAWWVTGLAALLLVAVTAMVLEQWVRRPYLTMGWIWYMATLMPVIGLVQVGRQALADRFTYVPMIGLYVMVVWGVWEMARARMPGKVTAVAAVGVLAMCAGLTVHQEPHWKDGETRFKRILEVNPNNSITLNDLGMYYLEANKTEEAISNFRAAVHEDPAFAEAWNNIGRALQKIGRTDEAIRQYQEAIRVKPDYEMAHYNLGLALSGIGRIDEAISQYREVIRLQRWFAPAYDKLGAALEKKGQIEEAIGQFQMAIRLDSDYTPAHHNLALALEKEGRMDDAIGEFRVAIHEKPGESDIHNNLGTVLNQKGQTEEAIGQFREAIALKPDYADAHYNLALALLHKGQLDEAIRELRQAIGLKVGRVEAHNILGAALGQKGQFEEAIGEFREAIRLEPSNYGAHFNLGRAYLGKGQTNEAIGEFRETLRLQPALEEAQKMLGALEGKR